MHPGSTQSISVLELAYPSYTLFIPIYNLADLAMNRRLNHHCTEYGASKQPSSRLPAALRVPSISLPVALRVCTVQCYILGR